MKLRVLHLEDNPDDVELVRSTLFRQGMECDIVAVNSGTAFLSALQHDQFDVILSDSGVPGYSGGAALSAARERDPAVPFVVVSANPDISGRRPQVRAGGTIAYVAKSELDRLAPTLRRLAPKRSPAASSTPETSPMQGLQRELDRRTAELEVLNRELESFSYSVAHDLRAPLITIDGFSQVLLESSADRLDEVGRDHLDRISAGVRRMHRLINDLLELSKIVVTECLTVDGDAGLLRIVLEHLLDNAWKFTARQEHARIEFGVRTNRDTTAVFHVRDNGVGFDPRYAAKLFNPFQRLHSQAQFPGNGIGLATVQRIIHRHGGEVWAESDAEHGACFYFTLPY
jgi:signal transduction histidine kinase